MFNFYLLAKIKTSKVAVTLTHHLAWAHVYNTVCILAITQASYCTKFTCMSHYFANNVCTRVYLMVKLTSTSFKSMSTEG